MPRILRVTCLDALPRGTLAPGQVDNNGALKRLVKTIRATLPLDQKTYPATMTAATRRPSSSIGRPR